MGKPKLEEVAISQIFPLYIVGKSKKIKRTGILFKDFC